MFKKILFVSLLSLPLLATTAKAQTTPIKEMPSGTYKLDKTHASVTWKVNHMGLSKYTARFTKMDASLDFDAKDPAQSKLVATIDPTSVKTDYPDADKKDFDKELAEGKDWFNGKKFPEIKFEAATIEISEENKGKIHGNLTFLGVTKPVTLNTSLNGAYLKMPYLKVPALGFSATTTIKRSDFNWKTYIPMIGDEVEILIEVEFRKEAN
jgi:polyisoprenoid-binding protein YceI